MGMPDELVTPRLRLRLYRWQDLDDIMAYATSANWARYLPVPWPYSRRDGERFLASQVLLDREREPCWAIEIEGHVVGGVNLRLSPEAPGEGSYCLELHVQNETPDGTAPALPKAPVWVTSPPITVPPGYLLEISGLVRVAESPIGLADPLLIFDSIGGEESALRVNLSPSWSPFRLVRAAPPGSQLRLTVALGGVGRAQIDGVAVRYVPLQPPSLAQSPQ